MIPDSDTDRPAIGRHHVAGCLFMVAALCCVKIQANSESQSQAANRFQTNSIILGGAHLVTTNDNELVFGGCNGQPVYRVQMSPQESKMMFDMIQRAKKD